MTRFVLTCCVLGALAGGCDDRAAPAPHTPPPAVEKTVTRDEITLRLKADKASAAVAEPIHLTLRVTAPPGVSVTLPAVSDTLGKFRVEDDRALRDIPANTGRAWQLDLTLTALDAGPAELPALTVRAVDTRSGLGQPRTLQTPAVPIRIRSVLTGQADPKQPRGIKGAVPIPAEPQHRWFLPASVAAGAVLAALAAAGLIIRYHRRRAQRAERCALTRLARIDPARCTTPEQLAELLAELTDILRTYLADAFDLAAPRLTTREFLDEMTAHEFFTSAQQQMLADLLARTDLVKFARLRPSADEARDALAEARAFVTATAGQARRASAQEAA